jgi:hypothetical protein
MTERTVCSARLVACNASSSTAGLRASRFVTENPELEFYLGIPVKTFLLKFTASSEEITFKKVLMWPKLQFVRLFC